MGRTSPAQYALPSRPRRPRRQPRGAPLRHARSTPSPIPIAAAPATPLTSRRPPQDRQSAALRSTITAKLRLRPRGARQGTALAGVEGDGGNSCATADRSPGAAARPVPGQRWVGGAPRHPRRPAPHLQPASPGRAPRIRRRRPSTAHANSCERSSVAQGPAVQVSPPQLQPQASARWVAALAELGTLGAANPPVSLWRTAITQYVGLDVSLTMTRCAWSTTTARCSLRARQLSGAARWPTCRDRRNRVTVPGVGPMTAIAFVAAIDDPGPL